ncbi:MAG: hypothetical protein JSV27_03755 [Candidatus Bathyarchaeota archaeon]|nr:MAG: hypothetical protein JSV27_03755 [Candidatus Bathyarchaeota archaeon]
MDEVIDLTFVALGDSLTAGYVPYAPMNPMDHVFPYTAYLDNAVIAEQSKKGWEHIHCTFINRGVNGDSTKGMLSRFDSEVASLEPDYVIVWAGINDLFLGFPLDEIMGRLKEIYSKARENGIEPVACTVTSITRENPVVPRIVELNELIRGYCTENHVPAADLFSALSDRSSLLLENFSSDGVHLNADGNRRVAHTIYSEVVEQILVGLMR